MTLKFVSLVNVIRTGMVALLLSAILPSLAHGQLLSSGQIAFTAFNADEDGWSLVALAPITPNQTIFFSDGTATSATAIGSGESSFQWLTGGATINAGTVIRFSAIDQPTRAASVGTFTVVNSTNLGLSATAETIYAFYGTSDTAPTTILSAVSSEANTNSLTTVGLTAGTNAIKLTSSTDFAEYTASRSDQTAFSDYTSIVNNPANWTINVGGDGSAVIPNVTAFTVVPEPATLGLLGLAGMLIYPRLRRRS